MFKKYIRNIVKEQIDDIRLENTLKQLPPKTYWEEHFKAQLKHTETLVKGRDKEIYRLKETIENLGDTIILKDNLLNEKNKEIEQLKKYREIDFKTSLQYGFQLDELKQENQKLKDEINHLKQQNAKLNLVFCGNNYEKTSIRR